MQPENPPRHSQRADDSAVALVLREARRLHRAARADTLVQSLPVLRRLLRSRTLVGVSLPELYRRRRMVQRKHILRTLAVEAGRASWEDYRPLLARMSAAQLEHFDIVGRQAGYPNHWFSTPGEARRHAAAHGGRPLQVGDQAVVLIGSD